MTTEEALDWIKARKEHYELDDDNNCQSLAEALDMAIKALQRDSCEDCIGRQAVIDTIFAECSGEKLDIDFAKVLLLRRAIKALPPIIPQESKWIPVSERLPKVADCYAVTRQIGSDLIVDACFFDGTNTWHNDNRINHERNYLTNIVAWMPLPEPYKAESEKK